MEDLNFRYFLINENKMYLGQQIGDVLNSVQELNDEVQKIGTRNLVRFSQIIVNKCRGILQGHWGDENKKYLLRLQKCAVALAKAIDENDNIESVLSSIRDDIEDSLKKMGVPFNTISQSETKEQPDEMSGLAAPDTIGAKPANTPSPEPPTPDATGFGSPNNAPINQMPNNLGL